MDVTLKKILEEISQGPMRSRMITAAALIDTMLETNIRKILVAEDGRDVLFSQNGCLSTFSSKIEMAYALGIVSKELRDDMNICRRIRNKCAHDLVIDERTMNSIKDLANNLLLVKRTFSNIEGKDVMIIVGAEVAIILFCLIKRLSSLEQISPFLFEVHDNYLRFSEEENECLSNFGEIFCNK